MLDKKGFDLWADGYDVSVGLSDEENTYPFAGYKTVLNSIYRTVLAKPKATVLEAQRGSRGVNMNFLAPFYDMTHPCLLHFKDH